MDSKTQLISFVDAVIAGDQDAEKVAFASYTELKTQELLGLSAPVVEPVLAEDAVTFTDADSALLETLIDDNINIEGNSVYVDGKKVGKLHYTGNDEMGDDAQLMFIGVDGRSISIKDNDIAELSKYLRKKFLGEV